LISDQSSRADDLQSIAVAHAKAGSKGLILVGRTTAGLEETKAAALAANSALKVLLVPTDISDEASVDKLYEAISGSFDAVDTLINNAGVFTE
jgi:short-subunit dehydrogenase